MLGKVIYHEGNRLVIEFEEEINPEFLKLLARDKENLTDVKLIDNEPKSAKQNALAHALIKDIAKHQEWPLHKAKQMMKDLYKEGQGIEFSHAEASMTEMNTWVEFLIEHVLSEGISLPKRYSYLLDYEVLLLLLQVPQVLHMWEATCSDSPREGSGETKPEQGRSPIIPIRKLVLGASQYRSCEWGNPVN